MWIYLCTHFDLFCLKYNFNFLCNNCIIITRHVFNKKNPIILWIEEKAYRSQGRIQDFKLEGVDLRKLRQKILFFPILGGGGCARWCPLDPSLEVSTWIYPFIFDGILVFLTLVFFVVLCQQLFCFFVLFLLAIVLWLPLWYLQTSNVVSSNPVQARCTRYNIMW
jgi:hypothetical protein